MPQIDLTEAEQRELRKLLRDSIELDRFKFSERVQAWKSVLAKLDPTKAQPKPAPAAAPRRSASELELMLRASVAGEGGASQANVAKLQPRAKRPRRED